MIRFLFSICILVLSFGTAWADTLTAARVVRPYSIITPDDLKVIEPTISGAFDSGADIIGLEAKVTLYPGRPILPAHVGPPALVERNQPVVVLFKREGLTISADARALSRGAAGDTVRVMNLASRTTVSGQVQSDGSVVVSRGIQR